jgi:RNA polymerase sigma-70 factor (ECF subfamily)
VDHFRRLRPASPLQPEEIESEAPGPESQASDTLRRNRLTAAIGALPPEQRDTLLLKLEAGLDLQSIADVTGVNRETAKSRLRYAVGKLKATLED